MSQQTPPPPAVVPARATPRPSIGAALTTLGVGVGATSLFGLQLSSQGTFDFTDYGLIHSVATLATRGRAADLFHGFRFWWDWGQLAFGAVLVVLAAVLVAGVARRVVGVVLLALTVVFGVLEVIALSKTPTYRGIQNFQPNGNTILGNATFGVWFGLVGLLLMIAGALVSAIGGRTTAVAPPWYPPPPASGPRPYTDYAPASEPPAKQL